MLSYTNHAIKRLQQRGKSAEGVKMLMRYGKTVNGVRIMRGKDVRREIARRQAWLERIQRRSPHLRRVIRGIRHRIQKLETMGNCAAVLVDGAVVTVYNRTRRRQRRRWIRRFSR